MKRTLTFSTCVLIALPCGVGLLRLALQPHYGPGLQNPWPLVLMGVGLLLAGASRAIDEGRLVLDLVFLRHARLTLFGGLTVGTTLVLVGLLGALTQLL